MYILEKIGKIADHDRQSQDFRSRSFRHNRQSQDFQKVIVSDCGSQKK